MLLRVLGACVAVSVFFMTGCDPASIQAVGLPGGVYRPDQGCTLQEAATDCRADGATAPELRFETLANPGVAADAPAHTLSSLRVSCARSYCGTGSLSAHADLSWNADPQYPQRTATFTYTFPAPVDLMGRTVSFSVFVDDVTVPMHAQIGVIYQYWRWVAWAPVSRGSWQRVSGVVSPANPMTKIDPGISAIPVTGLQIDVYVPANTDGPSDGAWSGEIFLDDIGW